MTDAWRLIQSSEALSSVLAEHDDAEVVALDTEFMRRNTFYPQVALVQLCFADVAYLVDPLALDETREFASFIGRSDILKVMHSPSEDLEVFRRWLGVLPTPLWDTQRAAALLGMDFGMGYRSLVAAICGVDLPKGETRSDWLQRPLTNSQCEYAAMDVTYLMTVWRQLAERAEDLGRGAWILADGEDMVATANAEPAEYYSRVKSAASLSPAELAALRAICAWREDTAKERDRPRSWIIDDKACLQLARIQPESMEALRKQCDLPPPVLRKHGQAILESLDSARGLSPDSLPAPLPTPLSAPQRQRLKALKERGRQLASSLSMAPEVLLSGKDYELLMRDSAGEQISPPRSWRGWRAQAAIGPLAETLVGEHG
ncbi:MAG: ribonuclease D [Pseudomonadota bacterium]